MMTKYLKLYVVLLLILTIAFVGWGIVFPSLISAKSTILVTVGIIGQVSAIPVLVYLLYKFVRMAKSKKEKENK